MLCALIMAGGIGSRFWPQSTVEKPKQFLKLLGDKTMIQLTYDRIRKIIPDERIFIATNKRYINLIKEQLPNIDVFLALGATIDFEAGNIKRAPKIFQELALEWFYRFLKEPRRMYRRYFIDDIPFFWYLLKQLLGLYKDPFEPKEYSKRE